MLCLVPVEWTGDHLPKSLVNRYRSKRKIQQHRWYQHHQAPVWAARQGRKPNHQRNRLCRKEQGHKRLLPAGCKNVIQRMWQAEHDQPKRPKNWCERELQKRAQKQGLDTQKAAGAKVSPEGQRASGRRLCTHHVKA